MIPKKIYLNYVDESDPDKTWSEEPISVYDYKMYNREYTDLSQVWHDASEEPEDANLEILCQDKYGCWTENRIDIPFSYKDWNTYTESEHIVRWAYISDLLPKGGKQ